MHWLYYEYMNIVRVAHLKLLRDKAIQQFSLIVLDGSLWNSITFLSISRLSLYLLSFHVVRHSQLCVRFCSVRNCISLLILHEQNEYKLNTLRILDMWQKAEIYFGEAVHCIEVFSKYWTDSKGNLYNWFGHKRATAKYKFMYICNMKRFSKPISISRAIFQPIKCTFLSFSVSYLSVSSYT